MTRADILEWRDGQGLVRPTADPGVLHGHGVFETMLGVRGRLLRPAMHFTRMCAGAQRLGLPPPPEIQFYEALRFLTAHARLLPLARLRLTWTPGLEGVGSLHGMVSPYQRLAGVRVHTSRYIRNERSAVTGVKTTSYAENLVALMEAREHGADEPIFGNSRGQLSEGATSNIFVEIDGVLLTPPLASGCLPGTARELCLEWGREAGLPITEAPLDLSILAGTKHAVVTSALKGVAPVTAIDGNELSPGKLSLRLQQLFEVRREAELKELGS